MEDSRKRIWIGLAVLVLLLSGASPADVRCADPGQEEDARVAWLRQNGIPLRAIDPEDDDFSDLMPLVDKIGDARMVMLGEQSHGDGTVFLLKGRLVRFLHQVMGFDVLAWESGLYDCDRMEAALHRDIPVEDALAHGIFAIWGLSAQVKPVFDYARSTYGKPRPLIMAGFDCQLSSRKSRETFADDLKDFIRRAGLEAADPGTWEAFSALNDLKALKEMDAEKREDLKRSIDRIRWMIAESRSSFLRVHGEREIAFWERVLANYRVYFNMMEGYALQTERRMQATDNNPRDAAMAETLLWLSEEAYPDRKIIVWAATFHNMRRIQELTTNRDELSYQGLVTMGHPVWERLGGDLYSIGFTAYQGMAGTAFAKEARDISTAPEGSLEDLCHRTGEELLFLDFSGIRPQAGHWLNRPLSSRPLGYSPMDAIWPRHLDAMIFTDKMIPSTKSPVEAERK